MEQKDSAAQVMTMMRRLPEREQEVLRLKFQGGLSYEEIARVTGLSASNVGFLIHSAVKKLRARLGVVVERV
jgi:RNA polymerase sigma-70 factor (ECF subfamily)